MATRKHCPNQHKSFFLVFTFFVALVFFSFTLLILLIASLQRNQGHLVYALDDGYIHMAVAKNLALHGVWGVTHDEFSSASSSPLWTLLLAGIYRVTGPSEMVPFILNIMFCLLTLVTVFLFLHRAQVGGWVTLFLLLALIYAGTLPLLVFVGMEHAMQVFLYILLLIEAGKVISDPERGRERLPLLALVAMLGVGTRYETIFLVGVSALILVLRRRFWEGLGFLLAGLLPVGLYGFFSIAQGGLFLPNTLLLKGIDPTVRQFDHLTDLLTQRWEDSRDSFELAFFSLAILSAQLLRRNGFWDKFSAMNLIFLPSSLLQIFFIGNNYFYRYEAVLICAGLLVCGISFVVLVRERQLSWSDAKLAMLVYAVLAYFAFRPLPYLWERAVQSLEKIVPATANIYEQQYQMGLFLRQYYSQKTVAANDIGAINFLADIQTVDLYGLSTQEVANLKMEGRYSRQKIADLAQRRQVDIALVYDYWYSEYGGLPREWFKVGEWRIFHNVVCGGEVVSFYAVRVAEAPVLLKNLRAFSARLPASVSVSLRKID